MNSRSFAKGRPRVQTTRCKMRKTSISVNSETDSRNRKAAAGHQPNRQSSCAPNDAIVFESRPDEDKAGYAISWNNIFYEVDDASTKTKLISRFFKRNKFKADDDQFGEHAKSGGSPNGQFSQSSIHIIERHQQMVEIINDQRSINISQKIENETIKQVASGPCKRVILNNISGSLRCGQLLGLIGPSGVGRLSFFFGSPHPRKFFCFSITLTSLSLFAGKSTLLQILSGRRTSNVKGEVYLHASEEKNLKECKLNKLSFIPQNDTHIENLTVKETLIYASKLKNNERAKELIKQNNQDNSADASSQDGSSNTTISLANTSPTNLTNSSSDTILYSGSNSSSSSLNVASHVDSSSVESNLVNPHHLAGPATHHHSAQRLAGASVHNVNLDQNLDRLETQTNSSSHSDRTAASVPNADTLEVNIVHEKQAPMLLNFTHVDQYHDYLVQQIIGQLMLDTCAQTFVSKCSGGQLKRLSIAIELLSEPKVLVMDEPTTGLDFSSALNCIQILKNLTINNFDPPGKRVGVWTNSCPND